MTPRTRSDSDKPALPSSEGTVLVALEHVEKQPEVVYDLVLPGLTTELTPLPPPPANAF